MTAAVELAVKQQAEHAARIGALRDDLVRRVIEAGLQALEGAAASAEMPSVKVVFGKRRGR